MNQFDQVDYDYETDEEGQHIVSVTNTDQAEGHLRALDNWRAEVETIQKHAQMQIDRASQWAEEEVAKIQPRIHFHESGLIAFLQVQGKKTIKLINGTLKRTAGRNSVVVDDMAALESWSEHSGVEVIRVKREADKKAIMDYVKKDGVVPDGVDIVTGDDSFKIDTK